MEQNSRGLELFNRIGNGRENAVKRPLHDSTADRTLRELINKANKSGDDLIIPRQDGLGYYRPMPSNKHDMLEYTAYMNKEIDRRNDIDEKLECMRKVMGQRMEEYFNGVS